MTTAWKQNTCTSINKQKKAVNVTNLTLYNTGDDRHWLNLHESRFIQPSWNPQKMMTCLVWLILARNFHLLSGYLSNKRNESVSLPSPSDVENFNSLKSAMIEDVISKELSANRCRWYFRDKTLRDIYFHVNDTGTPVHIHNSRIPSPKCAKITRVKSDLFANRMDIILIFPKVIVKGDVSVGEVRSSRLRDSYPFSLEIYNTRGSGMCFTKWTETGYEIINCDIHYEIPKTAKMNTSTSRFPIEETVFVSASVSRLWKGVTNAMNGNVIEGMNYLMRELNLMKYLRNPEIFQKYKNYVIQSTESANEFVDGIIDSVRVIINEKFGDSFDIPNINEGFRKKIILVTWRGSFSADHGTIHGLSTVTRVGDTAFATDNASQTHFFGNLSFRKLDLHYDRYKAEFMSFGPTGTLNTRLEPIRLHIHPYVNFNTGKIYLEDFEIEDVGDIDVEVTGLGTVLNWIVSKITTWVMGLIRDKILDDLQKKYDSYIKCILSGYTIHDISDGKVFARP